MPTRNMDTEHVQFPNILTVNTFEGNNEIATLLRLLHLVRTNVLIKKGGGGRLVNRQSLYKYVQERKMN